MKTAIIYGWAEGPWQGKRLRKALHAAGFSITKDHHEADILIAHSGGCFMLPRESKAKIVLLVGFPHWPGKHPMANLPNKIRNENINSWWLKKTIFNLYYLATQPVRWYRMWRAYEKQVVDHDELATVIFIRNAGDQFAHPIASVNLAKGRGWQIEEIEGDHDHLWRNPKSYVDLLKKLSKPPMV